MLCKRFKVQHKETKEISEVYDIIHTNPNTFVADIKFLVYLNNEFRVCSAKNFEPYVEDLNKDTKRTLNETISNK